MTGPNIPPPLQAFPRVGQWLSFSSDGTVQLLSGRVELGQGISTALTQIAADELDIPVSAFQLTQGHTGISPAEGPTVGSLSVTFGGQSVRFAAAAARHLFLQHAAEMLQVTPNDLTISDGLIFKNELDTGLSYAALADTVDLDVDAAPIAVVKSPATRKVAGQSVARVDLRARLGSGYLLHDMVLPGMLHGRVLQPPSVDAALDETAPLVADNGCRLVRDGRFLAVVGNDEYGVLREANRLAAMIPWRQNTPANTHPIDGLSGKIALTEIILNQGKQVAGAQEVSFTLTKPVLAHASIGPSCAVAQWEGDQLTVWAHSQNVFALRGSLARVLDISADLITVIFAPGSGCYGHNSSDDVALDAALVARASQGAPVRVLCQRQDEFQSAPLSPAMKTSVSARLDGNGHMIAYTAEVISPPHSTRPGGFDEPNLRAAQFLSNAVPMGPGNDAPFPQGGADRNSIPGYDIAAVHVVRSRPAVVPYRASAMRGLGAFTNVIALETLVELCAAKAGQDGIEYRLAHLSDPRARAVIETCRDMAGPREDTDGVGYGLGYARYKNSAGYMACLAKVVIADEVRVTDVWSAADVGEAINPDGTLNQIEGGIVQAIGWTLKEEIEFSGSENLTRNWDDYPIMLFSEVPRLHTELLIDPGAPPLGAGEISSGPAGAAVVNAVHNALGVAPTRLPLTRHALVSLLS